MHTGLKERLPQVTQDENEISPKDIREVARLRHCGKLIYLNREEDFFMTARQPSLLRCFLRLKVRLAINWIGSKNHKIFLTITVNFTNQENSLLLSAAI